MALRLPLPAEEHPTDAVGATAHVAAPELRALRAAVYDELATFWTALMEPVHGEFGIPRQDRAILALFVAALHGDAVATRVYEGYAHDHGVPVVLSDAVQALAEGSSAGPFGHYPETSAMADESAHGEVLELPDASVFGLRLGRSLRYVHKVLMHPRDLERDDLERLREAGVPTGGIVILTQIASGLSFHLRVSLGLRAIATTPRDVPAVAPVRIPATSVAPADPGTRGERPRAFTAQPISWDPWLSEIDHAPDPSFDWVGVFGKRRASSPSFRLSARDPHISLPLARLADEIFDDGADGLARAERELCALAVSRSNGCLFCASVHARATAKGTGRIDAVAAILANGVDVELEPRWNAILDAASALTSTPVRFGAQHVARLAAEGLDQRSMLDLVHSVGYFNFANRIMLALGAPVLA